MTTFQSIPETYSTNDDVLRLAREGAPEGTWLRADRQTGGRGRQGRAWISPPGNLHASTLVRLRPTDPPAPTLALVAAVALHEVMAHLISPPGLSGGAGGGPSSSAGKGSLRSLPPMSRSPCPPDRAANVRGTFAPAHPLPEVREGRLQIKWPNDILFGGAKLAGILLEREGDAVVIGFGANLAHHPGLPDRRVTSLAAAVGSAPTPNAVLVLLAETLIRWLDRWRSEGLASIRAEWLAAAHPIGTTISTPDGHGFFDGLDASGALRLRSADGAVRYIHAGDVFLV